MNSGDNESREGARARRDVSVAIAVYNGAAYLPELLDSIVSQTVPPTEIICADDASTDETVELLERFARSSPVPLKIIRHARNVGIVENFLSAFRATSGSLIAYCDQDDVWLPTKLEACLAAFADQRVSFVSHASIITDERLNDTGEVYYRLGGDRRYRFPAAAFHMHCWGHQVIFDRTALNLLLQFYECDVFRNNDLGTCFDHGIPFAASLTGDLCFKKEPLIKFRRHAAATSDAAVGPLRQAGLARRVAERLVRLAGRKDRLNAALTAIDACSVHGAKSIEISRQAFADDLEVVTRGLRLGSTNGMLARLAQLPQLALSLVRNRAQGGFRFKDLAADCLTALYAGQMRRANAQ